MVGNALAPQAFIFVSLLLAGLAMRSFASDFLDRKDATFAAILYATSYYLVVSALLRFAAAEVFSAAFLPLLLKYLLRSLTRPEPCGLRPAGALFCGNMAHRYSRRHRRHLGVLPLQPARSCAAPAGKGFPLLRLGSGDGLRSHRLLPDPRAAGKEKYLLARTA